MTIENNNQKSSEPLTQVENPKLSFFLTKRIILVVTIITATIIISSLAGLYYLNSLEQKTKTTIEPVSKSNPQTIPEIRKVNSPPKNINLPSDNMEQNYFGNIVITVSGSIEKTIKEGEAYKINLNGKKFDVELTPSTRIGKAWYEINKDNIIIKSSFDLITKEALMKSTVEGKRIKISFNKNDLNNNQIKAMEFVLNE